MPKKNSKPKSAKPAKPAKARSKPTTKASAPPPADAQPKRMSGLSAAAEVLRAAGQPMSVAVITERAREQGLWRPAGRTPAATLNSALVRDIAKKAGASRFRKASRGLFELNG